MKKILRNTTAYEGREVLENLAVGDKSFAMAEHPGDPRGCIFQILTKTTEIHGISTEFGFSEGSACAVRDALIEMYPLPKRDT